jgi:hypothetical protein
LLGNRLSGSLWGGWQLKNCSLLTSTEVSQEYDPAVWKFERIVMCPLLFFVDLPKDRGLMIDRLILPRPQMSLVTLNRVGKGQRWSCFVGQNGGWVKVDSGFDYAANFSWFACVA